MTVPVTAWIVLAVVVVGMLAVDLLAHRKAREIGFREAAIWSGVWVALALLFAGGIWIFAGSAPAVDFTTAWLLEKSLSIDNLFVFAVIFGAFAVPRRYQHRVLFYGVLGALVFRAVFLAAGLAIVNTFTIVLFAFGAVLIWSAVGLLRHKDDSDRDPGAGLAVRLLRRVMPVTDTYHGGAFTIREAGRRVATPLLAVVVAIEAADIMFAVDSVPAVLAVTSDTFIVYASNAFAILGLRSLYFLLSGLLERFHHLGKALAFILAFVGVKLFLQAGHKTISHAIPEIPSVVSLGVILLALGVGVVASLRSTRRPAHADQEQFSVDIRPETALDQRESSPRR